MLTKKIDVFTWNMLWSSVRYFIGRSSIQAVLFPCDIILNILQELDETQLQMLKGEIDEGIKTARSSISSNSPLEKALKNLVHWEKLSSYLNKYNRYLVYYDGEEIRCFEYEGKYVPIYKYLFNPMVDVYIDRSIASNIYKS